jgi:hypothetical protein
MAVMIHFIKVRPYLKFKTRMSVFISTNAIELILPKFRFWPLPDIRQPEKSLSPTGHLDF